MSPNVVELPPPWKRLNAADISGRPIFLATVPTIGAALSLPLPRGGFFKLFIASEVPQERGDASFEVATYFTFGGCCYMCAWGATCSEWDDAFDYAVIIPRVDASHDFGFPDDKAHLMMTTWHPNEELDDARWFFTFNAEPCEGFISDCRTCLAVAIGDEAFGTMVEASLLKGTQDPDASV